MARLAQFIYDEQIEPAIVRIIDGARKRLVLVSPFNEYSTRVRQALKRAAARKGLSLTVVCRKEKEQDERPLWEQLESEYCAKVFLVERLHAKIYFNESRAVVTSMNLYQSSAAENKEIGFRIRDEATIRQIDRYVRIRLIGQGEPLATPHGTANSGQAPALGWCIRDRVEIPYNPKEPLCAKCKRTWNRYKNLDFREKYCHHCGEERQTSFGDPLCGLHKETVSAK